ncbi:MAG: membrane protein insertase YidC [Candidatus Cardinium sp.]|uniref:membrane protein insertase YidC n=1 Tax=Cardinium endosymbiont of Dermatophagoides farinae TaxID=2597823 RepID=UPI001183F8A5|nr:membrane protein insertase YidC [Cardinium endosymbiont of Dermatophagoides farinae]TSJ80737.1 membrane protein insertase YidC [Cardinium endosymbiont of Dermatophagoides farinae]UWW96736.1 MAG: membrane protein insertase YidC [Candidatus Cardinium sp.]
MVLDKNKLVRLFLISAGFLVYFYVFKPKSETSALAPARPTTSQTAPLDVVHPSSPVAPFAALLQGKEKDITVENELLKVVLSTKGGTIKKVILKKFKDKHGKELVLLDAQSSNMGFSFPYQNALIETKALYFQTQAMPVYMVQDSGQARIVFRLAFTPSQYFEQSFTFSGNSYQIDYDWRAVGMEACFNTTAQPAFCWNMDMKSLEADDKADASRSTVNYYLLDQTFDKLKESATEVEAKKIEVPIKWVSIKQRFFSSAVIAQDAFATGALRMEPMVSPDVTKSVHLSLPLSAKDKAAAHGKFIFFFGPNDYKILKKVTKGFEQNLPLGWPVVKWMNQGLIMPLFAFLEKYVSNYGLVIFLLVIIIKLLLAPLSYRSFISMAKMQVLKPELDKIKEKYKNDLQKAQIEQVAFYREFGINPLSGCMPIMLQMPILMAMFHFFPHAIALRQASFLWANDLSTYDSVMRLPFTIPIYGNHVSLFTLLMVLSTILYTRASNQNGPKEGPMRGLSYVMPFAFMVVLNTFPAGLSFYYCISNVMTFLQQKLINYWVDADSIKEKLMARQQKVKQRGKLSFQSRVAASIEANNKKKK